jgi:hypothetical protein
MRTFIVALSAAAGLLLTGASAAQASAGHARPNATPACGSSCFDLSSLVFGTGLVQNAYIYGDTGVGGKVGKDLDLKFASNSHPNEDFTGAQVGTVADFCGQAGGFVPTSYACLRYASYPVFEADWSPFGNESGLCVGVATAGISGEPVTLRDCGASDKTLWIGDLAHETTSAGLDYIPWVNGSDPNFSHPLVLTVDPGTRHPQKQLKVEPENLLTGGVTRDSQEFTITRGPAA